MTEFPDTRVDKKRGCQPDFGDPTAALNKCCGSSWCSGSIGLTFSVVVQALVGGRSGRPNPPETCRLECSLFLAKAIVNVRLPTMQVATGALGRRASISIAALPVRHRARSGFHPAIHSRCRWRLTGVNGRPLRPFPSALRDKAGGGCRDSQFSVHQRVHQAPHARHRRR